jgi:cytochrome c-type biogenesis protein
MEFSVAAFGLAWAAGALSTLSPCVVPILPILVSGALARHRYGLWALAAGLALSFTVVGLFVATVGASIGLDGELVHRLAGVLLVAFGATMAVPVLQRAFARGTARYAAGGSATLARLEGRGWSGQFAVGALLGVVWTPCVGPTLGAASTLAGEGHQLGQVALLMLVFGLGAATPLVGLGLAARRWAPAGRERWLQAAEALRRALGVLLVAVGVLIVLGLDKTLEAWLVEHSPAALTELTTRF